MKSPYVSKALVTILLLVAISRAIMLFVGYTGMNLFASYGEPPVYEQQAYGTFSPSTMKLPAELADTQKPSLYNFLKFDSYAYLKIATLGYDRVDISTPHPPANWVFFPLFPLLLIVFSKLTGLVGLLNLVTGGIVLSNLFLIAALYYIRLICLQQGLSEEGARNAVILLLIYPTSLFFSMPYTESLFLLLSAASLYHARNKQYGLAFLAASLSTVTRVPGFINLFFVFGAFALSEGWPLSRKHWRLALYSALSLIPMGIYMAYMKRVTGDYLAPFHEQSQNWYRYTGIPFANYAHYFQKPYFNAQGGWDNGLLSFVITTVVLVVFLAYAAINWKKLGKEPVQLLLFIYGALLIVIPFSSQPYSLASVVRYMMVCIPLFLYAVSLTAKRPQLLTALQLILVSVNVITTIGFFNGYYFMA